VRWISGLLSGVMLLVAAQARGEGCTVSAVPVQFGQYNIIDPFPVDAVGRVSIGCDAGTAYTVKLGPGENSTGGFHPRKLRSDTFGEVLNYNLYRDSTHAEVWGDGIDGTFFQSGLGTGGIRMLTVYGRLYERQNVGTGLFRDSIVVTVEW